MIQGTAVIRRTLILVAAVLPIGALGAPRPVVAQGLSTAAGAFAGAGAGLWLSAAYITVEARTGNYVDSAEEAASMAAVPLFAGLAAGVALGAFGEDRIGETLTWGALGGAAGVGMGALIGDMVWDDPQRRWAGGVIGGAVGLVVGGVAGLISAGGGEDIQQSGGLPLMIRLRF